MKFFFYMYLTQIFPPTDENLFAVNFNSKLI